MPDISTFDRTDGEPGQQIVGSLATSDVHSDPRPTHDEIEARAYDLYLARGSEPGYEQDDWLEAERELLRLTTPVADDQS